MLDSTKEPFDLVSIPIQIPVVLAPNRSIPLRRNDNGAAARFDALDGRVGAVSLVGNDSLGFNLEQ